jgi:hypothetical protein
LDPFSWVIIVVFFYRDRSELERKRPMDDFDLAWFSITLGLFFDGSVEVVLVSLPDLPILRFFGGLVGLSNLEKFPMPASDQMGALFPFCGGLLPFGREIWKQIRDEANPGTAQSLHLYLKNTGVAERTPVWIKNDWDPGDRFVAEVVCGFSPLSCDDVNGCLKSPGYLMLMEDLKDKNEDFVKVHHLQVVDRNKDWIMVKLR